MSTALNPLGKSLGAGLLVSAALVLSACGGSSSSRSTGDDTNPTPTPAPTTAPTPTPSPTTSPDPTPTPDAGAKVSGPLDPVQDQVVTGVVSNEIASQLPEPLSGSVMCAADALNHLVDGPDAILAAAEGLATGADPFAAFNSAQADVQGAMERFAAQLQHTLVALADRGSCDPNDAGTAASTNPLGGTPLAPVGTALQDLIVTLEETGEDPNLTSVTSLLAPALTDLSVALSAVPAEVQNAPVLGGVFATIVDALDDLAAVLPAVGNYEGDNTAAGIATLTENLLGNVLTGVLPVADIDAATGQNFSAEIQAVIASVTNELGSGIGQVVTPLFNQGLNGALSPVLDPAEGLLAVILNPSALDPETLLYVVTSTDGSALEGILGGAAGDGNVVADPLDTLLAVLTAQQGGLSIDDLLEGSGLVPGSTLVNLAALTGDAGSVGLDGLLGDLSGYVTGFFDLPLEDAIDTVLGGLLGGLL